MFGATNFHPENPTQATIQLATVVLDTLKERSTCSDQRCATQLQRVRHVLAGCRNLDALLKVFDERGFNVVQVAVVNDDVDILRLLIDEGCSVNKGKCTLPLHVACFRGSENMVQLLLSQGADRFLEMGMCYPNTHQPVRHVPSRFHFLETNIYTCDTNLQLPLLFAIERDHVHVARLLLAGTSGPAHHWPHHRKPLHHACKHGSTKCVKHLARLKPSDLNVLDEEGLSPLLHAVSHGKQLVSLLEGLGADVRQRSSRNETALHVLFTHMRYPQFVHETTHFLLGTGLEQDANQTDKDGNTALHVLVRAVNRRVETLGERKCDLTQEEWDATVVKLVKLLLLHNCDVNMANHGGVTALHKLILLFDYASNNELSGLHSASLPSRTSYKVDVDCLHSVLQLLLLFGANPDGVSTAGRTSLIMLLQCANNIEATSLSRIGGRLVDCMRLLCENGARPSSKLKVHIATLTCLTKLGQKCLTLRSEDAKQHVSDFICQVIALLLQHGFNSNYSSFIRKSRAEGASGNILFELVKLVQHIRRPSDLLFIHSWVLTALQWGANPDIEPFPSDPVIYQSHSSIFLKNNGTQAVNAYMYEIQDFNQLFEGGFAESLLTLFINSMDHGALYQGLNAAKVMSRYDAVRSPTFSFLQLVNSFASQPRSLRQMARVAIYKALDRQLQVRVPRLPLPKLVQNYLINIS